MNLRVVLLTNSIPPYRLSLLQKLSKYVDLTVLLSTQMDSNHSWQPDWNGLSVTIQRSLHLRATSKHPRGFTEPIYIHIPYDTIPLLSKIKPNVVISHEMGMRTLQTALFHRFNSHCRLIIWATLSEQSEQGRGRWRELLRYWLLRQADAVLVNGESGARYVKRFAYPEEKIFRVPQTTDINIFTSVSLKRNLEQTYRLLYVGRIIELKGIEQFINVLCCWAEDHSERSLEFWLAGKGPLRQRLEQLSTSTNLAIRFLGNKAYKDLPQVYAQAGIFVFPTLADEWGLVINEAMAAGCPVIGSVYSQAVEDLVGDGVNGWLFRPDDSEDMYRALDRALSTPPKVLEQMGIAARRAVEGLTPEVVATRILDAIRYVNVEAFTQP